MPPPPKKKKKKEAKDQGVLRTTQTTQAKIILFTVSDSIDISQASEGSDLAGVLPLQDSF